MRVPDKYKEVKAEITLIYHENKGRYGYRRITTELHNRGFSCNHKAVQRLMRELGLVCRVRIKKYRSYRGEVGKIAPNLLNREFHAEKPNQKWVTDVTEFNLFGQKLYLSPILDLHNGYLVSYTLSQRPILSMVTTMLEKAFETIPDGTDLILHSDQGWQYQHKQYQRMLRKKSIRQSMSRKGNCLDNAVMENFFGLLKSELLYLQKFKSMEHFKLELLDYLDYYNNRRIKAKLKGLPPAIHRQQALSAWGHFTLEHGPAFKRNMTEREGGVYHSGGKALGRNGFLLLTVDPRPIGSVPCRRIGWRRSHDRHIRRMGSGTGWGAGRSGPRSGRCICSRRQ